MKPSFLYRSIYRLVIDSECIIKTHISCPDQHQEAKDLLSQRHVKAGRYDPQEHLKRLSECGAFCDPQNPMFVLGIRNVMSNHRCIVYTENDVSADQPPPYAVSGELPLRSQRPYYAMAADKSGELQLIQYQSDVALTDFQWLFSGVPVLWDDLSQSEIFRRILTEAADHSHVFDLPRGSHPNATDETRSAWQRIHEVFIDQLYVPLDTAYQALKPTTINLKREDNYMHSIMGVDDNNNLLLLIDQGRLEVLGAKMKKALGAKRAICVENSGSVTQLFYPKGIHGEAISLIAAPNHRRPGTAFLVLELENQFFSTL